MRKITRQLLRSCVAATALAMGIAEAAAPVSVQGTLHGDQSTGVYSRNIFGQFAEHLGTGIYGGIWVGEDSKIPNTRGYRNDVVAALKNLKVPVVRWPGGCFADEYHWRDGVGPREQRPVSVNTHWGNVTEPNSFGTHEFMDFAELIGADAYVAGNVGNASPDEMAQWVEYITADSTSTLAQERRRNGRDKPWKMPYFGVGNELWGCGGNLRAEYAADLYRRYQTFVKAPPEQKIIKVAPGANVADYEWTEAMMKIGGKFMDALSLHYYTIPGDWPPRSSSTDFDEALWIETLSRALRMDELIRRHSEIMDKYDPEKKVALYVDEWGTWYAGLPGVNPGFLAQQNTLRDALVAALHLNIFAAHTDRVKMTNIAQMINVLQAMILTRDDRMVLTPTYHVFEMYKPFQDATVLPLELKSPDYSLGTYTVPAVQASAVRATDGRVHIALANLDPNRASKLSLQLDGIKAKAVSGRILTAGSITALNTFDKPEAVKPVSFKGAKLQGKQLTIELPAKSVVVLDLQ